ncbi:uncharacterized protein LOC62_01G001488 [Vanrija pseudolonga]|uniref:Uncharacterized protein n=1 Tax=Vanrija pseudolonga TaxID=143232 RepID=A0AAF0Y4I4_9TREE|nr:hypothetical protein LOC62_01G001488 [Vanrija pseudolonga]
MPHPGSPTRQRIFEFPSANFSSFAEPHGAHVEPIQTGGRNPGGRGFWPARPPPTTTTQIKPLSFPKASGDSGKYRPTSVPRQIESGPTVPIDVPSRLLQKETSRKNQSKRKSVDNDASRVETFDDIRASSPLAGIGLSKTPLVPNPPPPKPPVKTGHFVSRLSKSLPPFVNHAALWKQTIDRVSKDERFYTIDDLAELRIGLDNAVTKMMGNVHAASETHNQLKGISVATLDERKRKTTLYEQETARRKETASTVASSQVRKKAKFY